MGVGHTSPAVISVFFNPGRTYPPSLWPFHLDIKVPYVWQRGVCQSGHFLIQVNYNSQHKHCRGDGLYIHQWLRWD